MQKDSAKSARGVSRRSFMRRDGGGSAAVVAEELIAKSKAPAVEIHFPIARACKEAVAALIWCPVTYGVIHTVANIGIPTFSDQHEVRWHMRRRVHSRLCRVDHWFGTEGPGVVLGSTEASIQLAYLQPPPTAVEARRSDR